ncbi:uncharacterized protein AMSG_01184 [Thecamonas trahens ATCC 50062]|uniref:MRH domain-containing protein n=1 Tax=Thecamonas trahens ATCC 50062 TaxID=461836 RepID=A0A0L0DMG9_THETB|nr:hypothetical protein AMSG_01184 [Thecamonas trahens ATCC 50062]KNC53470.1 hypothetical protein AMSG_01184 [Thecamonas trahens ATCC 50062]|eukprot:XP_013761794.1 hypothetical protein AMSG_01184 [Thecamonas trahens ATCC 50062]
MVATQAATCPATLQDGDELYHVNALASLGPFTTQWNDGSSTYTYKVDPCDTIASCGGDTNQAGCQVNTDAAKSKGMGKSATAVYGFDVPGGLGWNAIYTDGTPCHDGTPRSFRLTVLCDKSVTGTPVLEFDGETSHCHYEMVLRSGGEGACPADSPSPSPLPADCTTFSPEGHPDVVYEPHLLNLPGEEAYHATSEIGHYMFDLDVCGPVTCAGGDELKPVGVCQYDIDASRAFSLGTVESASFEAFDDATAGYRITYSNGEQCHDGTSRKTILAVYCSPSTVEPVLTFVAETAHCEYLFSLKANIGACPSQAPPPPPPPPPTATCPSKIVDSDAHGEFWYSPSKLASIPPFTTTATDPNSDLTYTYTLSVCHPLSHMCGDGDDYTAVCQAHDDIQFALGSSRLVYAQPMQPARSGYMLQYGGGSKCHDNTARSTRVYVMCDPTATTPELVFGGETSHCQYEFTLTAAEACPDGPPSPPAATCSDAHLPSQLAGGLVYNFHSLLTSSAEVTAYLGASQYDFEVNVCGAVDCPKRHDLSVDAGACQSWDSHGHMRGLGDVASARIVELPGNDGYTVTYTGGDSCADGTQRATIITVECMPNPDQRLHL